jgi:protein-disulfide isomerase
MGQGRSRWALAAAITLAVALPWLSASADDDARNQNVLVLHEPASELPYLGPANAPVTAELFLNPSNRHAKNLHRQLVQLSERHPTRLRVVYRIASQRGQLLLPEAVLEAHAQGKFHQFLSDVLDKRISRREDIIALAQQHKIDTKRLEAAWDDGRHGETIEANLAHRARVAQRVGTKPARWPEVLFNGVKPNDAPRNMSLAQLETAYDEAYERGKALFDEGVPLDQIYGRIITDLDDAEEPATMKIGRIDGDDNPDKLAPAPPAELIATPVSTEDLPAIGPEDAPVTIVLFCNFASYNCAYYDATALQSAGEVGLLDMFEDDIRFYFHAAFDEDSEEAGAARLLHEAALCAGEQGAFWRFYDQQMAERKRRSSQRIPAVRQITRITESLGLDQDQLGDCIEAGRYAEDIDVQLGAAVRAGVTQTPSLSINGRLYVGTKKLPPLRRAVIDELGPGLLEQWVPTWLTQ